MIVDARNLTHFRTITVVVILLLGANMWFDLLPHVAEHWTMPILIMMVVLNIVQTVWHFMGPITDGPRGSQRG